MDWIDLAQGRDRWWALVKAVMNLQVPQNAGKFLTSCKPVSLSRRTLLHGVINICLYTVPPSVFLVVLLADFPVDFC
jgi:hypothetical protein